MVAILFNSKVLELFESTEAAFTALINYYSPRGNYSSAIKAGYTVVNL